MKLILWHKTLNPLYVVSWNSILVSLDSVLCAITLQGECKIEDVRDLIYGKLDHEEESWVVEIRKSKLIFRFRNLFSLRIIEPLASRCSKFRFRSLDDSSSQERLQSIALAEGVDFQPGVSLTKNQEILSISLDSLTKQSSYLPSLHLIGSRHINQNFRWRSS